MALVAGREVYITLDEVVDPKHTALVVVDVQNDYFCAGGAYEKIGRDISPCQDMLPRLKGLIEQARGFGVPIVYIQNTTLPDYRSLSGPYLRVAYLHFGMKPGMQQAQLGSWGGEIVGDIAPRPDDTVIRKYRPSAFIGTNLDLYLRSNGIESIVVTGCATEGCVLSTAEVGFFLDYYVVVVEDCVSTADPEGRHQSALHTMTHYLTVVPAKEVVDAWSQASARGVAESAKASSR